MLVTGDGETPRRGSGAARGISIPHKPGAWWAFSCHFDAAAD